MLSDILKFYVILFIIINSNGQHEHIAQLTATVSEGEPLEKSFKAVGSKAYHFGQNKVSWHKATLICRSLKAQLASFDTHNDLKDLSNYVITNYGTARSWWLSCSDQVAEGDFFWYSTGRRFGYADWSPGQPDNENCVYLEYHRPTYQMGDGKCDRKMYYICENSSKTIILNV